MNDQEAKNTQTNYESSLTQTEYSSIATFLSGYYSSDTEKEQKEPLEKEIVALEEELQKERAEVAFYYNRSVIYQNESVGYQAALNAMGHPELSRPVCLNESEEIVEYNEEKGEWILRGHIKNNPYIHIPMPEMNHINGDTVPFSEIPENSFEIASIAVQLHLYYEDLIPEFFSYLNHIPYPFDLYVSCRQTADVPAIGNWFRKLRYVRDIIIRKAPNKGRDIAPVYVLFAEELMKHDFFLHIHTKKSLYCGRERKEWRKSMLDGVLGEEALVRRIFALFRSDQNIGLIFPEPKYVPAIAQHWLSNIGIAQKLCKDIGIAWSERLPNYPVGSFFWAKKEAVKPLFDRNFSYDDFPDEAGQTDGTLAHALERMIGIVCKATGNQPALIDIDDQAVRIGESRKLYYSHFSETKDSLLKYLLHYHTISFDVFDTLITRRIYQPDHVFSMMELILRRKMKINCDFLQIRKKAEAIAVEKYGAKTSIHEIYEEMPALLNCSSQIAEKIKELEIQTELQLTIPRKEILWIFNELKNAGKRIILVSDMYLPSDILTKMLNQCGYEGWDDLWVSCEIGLRKDEGSIWDELIKKYPVSELIHVGDNFRSDIQAPEERKICCHAIFSPTACFGLSNLFGSLMPEYAGTVPESLLLGTVVNGYLCNSPFCFSGFEGNLKELDIYDAGAALFGPILYTFLTWLQANTDEDEQLLFLSREGWLLQKLYLIYCEKSGVTPRKNNYFLTSRRAASVAAIRKKQDIYEILSQTYDGTLSNLIQSRFGVNLPSVEMIGGLRVNAWQNRDLIMKLLEPNFQKLFEQAKSEREAYIAYWDEQVGDAKKVTVVDLGYSGTIQYFLSKMLGKPISGKYLLTWGEAKPKRIGATYTALFENDPKRDQHSDLMDQTLLLEGALEAPFGQFLRFERSGKDLLKHYSSEMCYPHEMKIVQEGIADVCKTLSNLFSLLPEEVRPGAEFVKKLYVACCHETAFENLMEALCVQDEYCSNGNFTFRKGTKIVTEIKPKA